MITENDKYDLEKNDKLSEKKEMIFIQDMEIKKLEEELAELDKMHQRRWFYLMY